jgi:hypothetical protein
MACSHGAPPGQPFLHGELRVIEIRTESVGNGDHFSRLLAFCRQVLVACREVDITPVLSGSLAVLTYTQAVRMCINDIDLACSEQEFALLSHALAARGIAPEIGNGTSSRPARTP